METPPDESAEHSSSGEAERECFVVGPIGEAESETRKRSDKIYKYVVAPVVEPRGYKLLRADKIGSPGVITSQVIEHVVNASLVIADLSERNANAFYELAIRHAFRRPFVQLISVGWDLPFDVAAMRTVFVDLTDPDRIEEAKRELAQHLDTVERDPAALETPISAVLDLQELRSSGDALAKAVADIQTTLSAVLTELRERLPAVPGAQRSALQDELTRRERRELIVQGFERIRALAADAAREEERQTNEPDAAD
jgi:hypothetical protein